MSDKLQSQPTAKTFRLAALVAAVRDGDIRVPHFQRSFRWDSRDVLRLFDSILRGFPIGSVLLWQRFGAEDSFRLGAIDIQVPSRSDALWVVDGQQRITSLVNAVTQEAYADDERFRIDFSLDTGSVIMHKHAQAGRAVPLPILFDLRQLLAWIQKNPGFSDEILTLNDIAARLQNFELPASIVSKASQEVMQEIFDRMNSSGKRLRRAEIFSALFAPEERMAKESLTVAAIGDHIAGTTTFGRIDDDTVLQVILARRGPDTTRDIRREFDSTERQSSEFPNETRDQALSAGEKALYQTVDFLQTQVGVPHFAFLPYRFLLITLSRFLAHFPKPHPRNAELLNRWFWLGALAGPEIFKGSATGAIRAFNGRVQPGRESESAQNLIDAVTRSTPLQMPNLRRFRTNESSTRIALAALWERGPQDIQTGQSITSTDIAEALDDHATALEVSATIVRGPVASGERRQWAANRIISVAPTDRIFDALFSTQASLFDSSRAELAGVRHSHIISDSATVLAQQGDYDGFLEVRDRDLERAVSGFIQRRTGAGFENTPPLSEFDFDEVRDDAERPYV